MGVPREVEGATRGVLRRERRGERCSYPHPGRGRVHSRVLNCMKNSKEAKARTSFVQILVQLAHNEACVSDLLNDNVVSTLSDEIGLATASNSQ